MDIDWSAASDHECCMDDCNKQAVAFWPSVGTIFSVLVIAACLSYASNVLITSIIDRGRILWRLRKYKLKYGDLIPSSASLIGIRQAADEWADSPTTSNEWKLREALDRAKQDGAP